MVYRLSATCIVLKLERLWVRFPLVLIFLMYVKMFGLVCYFIYISSNRTFHLILALSTQPSGTPINILMLH